MGFWKCIFSRLFAGDYPLGLFFATFATLIYTPVLILYDGGEAQSLFTLFSFFPALGVCVIILTLSLILNHFFPKLGAVSEGFFAGLALYLLITILFFPVQSGVLDGGAPSFSKADKISHLVLFGLCLAIALIGLYKTKMSMLLRKVVAVLGCFSIISGIYMGISVLPLPGSDTSSHAKWQRASALSAQENIIVICLDMVQREFAQDYFENSLEAQKNFDGFVFFSNTASASPLTALSLSAMIRGHVFEGSVSEADPNDNLLNDMAGHGYNLSATPLFSERIMGGIPNIEIPVIPPKNIVEQFIAAVFLGINRYVPFKVKDPLALEKEFGWRSKIDQRDSFKTFINLLHIDNTFEKRFIWLHSLQTHYPTRFTKEGRYSKRLTDDDVYGEIADSLNMEGELITKLKNLGVYDNTMIIFISDHGFAPLAKMKTLTPEQSYLLFPVSTVWWQNNKEAKHVVGRYEPMIMVKPFNAHGALTYSNSAVSLPDIRKTLNEAVSPGSGVKLEGVNILDYNNLPQERVVRVFKFAGEQFSREDYLETTNWKIGELRLPIQENYKSE